MNGTEIENLKRNKREMKANKGFAICNYTAYSCITGKHHPVSFDVFDGEIEFNIGIKSDTCIPAFIQKIKPN